GLQARGQRFRLVGHRHADSRVPHVEGQVPHGVTSIAPGLRLLDWPRKALSSFADCGSMPAKYKIVQELGVGGMGKVYKGLLIGQAGFQRPVVMKRLRDAQDPENLRLLVEEARRYAVLDHENIGNILDFENIGNELCIILEYIDGVSLGEYLERHRALKQLPE